MLRSRKRDAERRMFHSYPKVFSPLFIEIERCTYIGSIFLFAFYAYWLKVHFSAWKMYFEQWNLGCFHTRNKVKISFVFKYFSWYLVTKLRNYYFPFLALARVFKRSSTYANSRLLDHKNCILLANLLRHNVV